MNGVRRDFGTWLLALGLFCALSYTTLDLGISAPNERSRLYLSVAIYEHHTFRIDEVRARFGPILDEARFAGHYFTDKAPGSSLLGLVACAVLRLFVEPSQVTVAMLLECARYGVMVPIGVASFFVFSRLGGVLGLGRVATRRAAFAYLFATPAFHYSAAFFGHQIVALGLLSASLLVLARSEEPIAGRGPIDGAHVSATRPRGGLEPKTAWSFLAAGAIVGMSVITEYQALLGALGVLALASVSSARERGRRVACFVLGGVPFAAFLAYYHTRCFGGPFELSYHHLANSALASVHRQGLGGVMYPTLEGLWGTLLSLHRGLIVTSPFVMLAIPGARRLWQRGQRLRTVILSSMILGQLTFVAASATWEAGWGFGPRLLVPVLPLICLLVAAGLDEARPWVWSLANSAILIGFVSFQLVTALFAEPPNELRNPWLDVILPLASYAAVAPNLGSRLLGLSGWWSLVPLALVYLGLGLCDKRRPPRLPTLRSAALGLVAPGLVALCVLSNGPSANARQRADFVRFVQHLRR